MTNYAKDHVPDWSRRPNAERLTQLIDWISFKAVTPITGGRNSNFRRWLVELAYDNDETAACSNGHDHACNRGLGEWLGIEPYGQGTDGSVPWNKQVGFSSERLNRYADPAWVARISSVPFDEQKRMYCDLLVTLRDTGNFDYSVRELIPAELDDVANG